MSRIIRYADLALTPWRNGAGRKADIAAGEGWHVGFAFLDADAPFSDFSGHDRTITLVDGEGFELEVAGQGVLRVERPHVPVSFDGGAGTTCRLLGGACRVLNAMTERARRSHRVTVGPAASGDYAVLLAGHAGEMDALDAVERPEGRAGLFWSVTLTAA